MITAKEIIDIIEKRPDPIQHVYDYSLEDEEKPEEKKEKNDKCK
jgi:hypothetical protein